MRLSILSLLVCAIVMVGCVPIYQPDNINATSMVNVKSLNTPEICTDKGWNKLQADDQGYVRVPYGKRVIIAESYYLAMDKGIVIESASCKPIISFIPAANQKYYANFIANDGKCGLELLRYSDTSRLGLVVEPTAQPATCTSAQ